MPFGLGKKEKGGDLDSQKASLFGKSKSTKSQTPTPASSNPYAVPSTSNDPYAQRSSNPYATSNRGPDPYAQSQSSLTQPPTSSFGSLSLNSEATAPPAYGAPAAAAYGPGSEKSPVPVGGYGGTQSRYPAQTSYGQRSGYGGANPYGEGSAGRGANPYGDSNSLRPGGYGGLGRSNSRETMNTEAGRSALFGDAAKRAQKQEQDSAAAQAALEQNGDSSYSNAGGYGSTNMPGGYGNSTDRELTAEEQEEQDVQAVKNEIKFIKQQDVASTRNALRIAQQAEQTGRETLARLGAQGDRIHNTERNLDLASHQNRLAEEKARELKTLNRSMFAVHVANPFTAKKREEAANAIALEKHQRERAIRDATAAEAYSSAARQQAQSRDLRSTQNPAFKKNLADRAKYQFEADSEDEEMENEIDSNLDQMYQTSKVLNQLGRAMGDEIDSQNKHIDRIINKTDKVDDQIAVNRARLDRIR